MYYVYAVTSFFIGLFIANGVFSYQSKYIDPSFWSTIKYQVMVLPLFLVANIFIGYGVKWGYKAVGSLTFVLAGSKALEMIIFLIMGFIFYAEVPTWKTAVGLIFVVMGLIIAKL
jgi:drug/metabolite transporter (DMT)-like permease